MRPPMSLGREDTDSRKTIEKRVELFFQIRFALRLVSGIDASLLQREGSETCRAQYVRSDPTENRCEASPIALGLVGSFIHVSWKFQ